MMLFTRIVSAESQYPVFQKQKVKIEDKEAYDKRLLSNYPFFDEVIQFQLAEKGGTLPSSKIEAQLNKSASLIPPRVWSVVAADGKMDLPGVLISEYGIEGGLDNLFRVSVLSASEQEQTHLEAYALFWGVLLDQHPQRAFALMAESAAADAVSTIDVLRITASIGLSPGSHRLSASPNKSDWEALHRSRNPCYRFLALEFFDSVPQSPDELLVRYRECLFGACGYMEGRALQAINRNEDYREAVAKLLEAYVASHPTLDDGTIPQLRDNYRDRIRNSTEFIQRIRDYIAKNGEKMPTSASPTVPNSTPSANTGNPVDTNPKKQQASADTTRPAPAGTSLVWLVVVIAVIAAVGLLWLLLKKRK